MGAMGTANLSCQKCRSTRVGSPLSFSRQMQLLPHLIRSKFSCPLIDSPVQTLFEGNIGLEFWTYVPSSLSVPVVPCGRGSLHCPISESNVLGVSLLGSTQSGLSSVPAVCFVVDTLW